VNYNGQPFDAGVPKIGTSATEILSMIASSLKGGASDMLGSAKGAISGAASAIGGAVSNPNDALGAAFGGIIDKVGMFGERLLPLITSVSSLSMIMDPLGIILQGIMEVLAPVINELLAPILGILKIIGNQIGQFLIPIVKFLVPVIETVANALVWLSNNILVPIGNSIYASIMVVVNGLLNFADLVKSVIDNWYKPWEIRGGSRSTNWMDLYNSGPMKGTSLEDAYKKGNEMVGATAGTVGGGTSGSAASYQQQRDITVNVTINTDALVGTDGIRAFSLMIGRELKSAGVLGLA